MSDLARLVKAEPSCGEPLRLYGFYKTEHGRASRPVLLEYLLLYGKTA